MQRVDHYTITSLVSAVLLDVCGCMMCPDIMLHRIENDLNLRELCTVAHTLHDGMHYKYVFDNIQKL